MSIFDIDDKPITMVELESLGAASSARIVHEGGTRWQVYRYTFISEGGGWSEFCNKIIELVLDEPIDLSIFNRRESNGTINLPLTGILVPYNKEYGIQPISVKSMQDLHAGLSAIQVTFKNMKI